MRALVVWLALTAAAWAQAAVTEWRVAGGFGRHANTDFERSFAPEADQLRAERYGDRFVERFDFVDGVVEPADYMRGAIFYAAAEFTSHAGEQEITVQSAGSLKLWVDGKTVLVKDDRFRATPESMKVRVPLSAGKHRLLVKFTSRAPFRIEVPSGSRARREESTHPLRAQIERLLDRGEHAQAAAVAKRAVAGRPLDRTARLLLVRALHGTGDNAAALAAARELVAIAPGSKRFAQILARLERGALAPFAPPSADAAFGGERFFARWRRDARQVIADSGERRYSGGPAVTLLDDMVVEVQEDGARSIYVHQLVRVLSKEGLQKYGEVSLPPGARVLELRTLRADGTIAEPELTHNKASISMPGAAPGDVIQQEYVVHARAEDEPVRFAFGSFATPVLRARLVLITATEREPAVAQSAGVPAARAEHLGEPFVRIWEKDDIPQSVRESAMLPRGNLPVIEIGETRSWDDIREQRRAEIIALVRAAHAVDEIACALPRESAEQTARAIFARVRQVREHEGVAAEEALSTNEGSRLGALLALGHAAGFEADVLLGRRLGVPPPNAADHGAYAMALVRLRKDGNEFLVDPAADAFGHLPAALAPDALHVPVFRAAREDEPATVALHLDRAAERSLAEAEVQVGPEGTLEVTLAVRLGATRGAQLRARLLAMTDADRRQFFFDMGQRIFRDAAEVSGTASDLSDPDRPLELRLKMRVARALRLHPGSTVEQFAPPLGLAKMYATAPERRFPLFIEAPLQETAVFRIYLPDAARIAPTEFETRSEFGSYRFSVRPLGAGAVEIRREFDVPVQVIAPERYVEFSRFATEIEQAERRRLPLERIPATLRAD